MNSDNITRLGNKSIVMKFYDAERWCWNHHLRILSKIIWRLIYILFNCSIPPTAVLEEGVNIAHGIGIVIHQNSVTKIHNELGWLPETTFEDGIKKTIAWYLDNRSWWEEIISGEYQNYYEKIYGNR